MEIVVKDDAVAAIGLCAIKSLVRSANELFDVTSYLRAIPRGSEAGGYVDDMLVEQKRFA